MEPLMSKGTSALSGYDPQQEPRKDRDKPCAQVLTPASAAQRAMLSVVPQLRQLTPSSRLSLNHHAFPKDLTSPLSASVPRSLFGEASAGDLAQQPSRQASCHALLYLCSVARPTSLAYG